MKKRICPRCDRVLKEWQPVHLYCFADRLRYWFYGIGALFLLLILGLTYQNVVALTSHSVELATLKTLTPTSETVALASEATDVSDNSKSATSSSVTMTPTPTRIRPSPTPPPATSDKQNLASDSLQADSSRSENPTATPRPADTPSPTRKPTSTPTPRPEPTSTFTPALTRPSCSKSARGEFAGVWQYYGAKLGCPIQETPIPNSQTVFVEQPFSQGHMFYFESGPIKFVIVKYGTGSNGTWQVFDDNWDGKNDNHCFEAQQIEPRIVRGFNLIWCTHPEIREPLGWPLDVEKDLDLELSQGFENGFLVRDSDGYTNGLVYVFFNDGTYERVPYR